MKNTDNLKSEFITLEADSSELEMKIKAIDDGLVNVHEKLSVSETIHERLSSLDSSLKLASDLLGIVRIIPSISVAASNTKRAIDLFREPVGKAKKVSGDLDQRVKPLRTKVHDVQQEVAKLDNEFKSIISEEQNLIQSLNHAQVCILSLPPGSLKTQSTEAMEAVSDQATPPLSHAVALQHSILEAANAAENKINQVKENAQSLIEIEASIARVMSVLNPLIDQLQAIRRAFNQTIRIAYGGYPKMCRKKVWPGVSVSYPCGWQSIYYSFSIQQILDGINGVVKPVMDVLEKAMNAILNPLLKALNLEIKMPEIPGLDKLDDIANSLASIFDPIVNTFRQLKDEASVFQTKLHALFDFTQQYNDIYQACVLGETVAPETSALMTEYQAVDIDPAMFNAMATLNNRSYLFQGDLYWIFSADLNEAQGPFAQSDDFKTDDGDQRLSGPVDAACAVGDRLCLFKDNNYYLCSVGEEKKCEGPMAIEGHWGALADGQPLKGPFDAAVGIDNRYYLFQNNRFFIFTIGSTAPVEGPHPIKGFWGNDDQGEPLDGPFDAVTTYAGQVYIRKGASSWNHPINTIRALT